MNSRLIPGSILSEYLLDSAPEFWRIGTNSVETFEGGIMGLTNTMGFMTNVDVHVDVHIPSGF